MIVEHAFVTTLEAAEAMELARRFLEDRGFRAERPPEAQTHRLVLQRGRKSPARAWRMVQLPQEIKIEWDRGRIVLVASIVPRSRFISIGWKDASGAIAPESDRRQRIHKALLFAIARSLEALLAKGANPVEAGSDWLRQEQEIDRKDHKRHLRRQVTLVAIFIAFVVFIFILISRMP